MITAKILAFGSARQDSFNKKLVKIAVEGVKPQVQTRPIWISVICPYRSMMRIWGGWGLPENALKLKALMKRIRDSSLPAQNTTVRSPHCWKSIGHRVLNPVNPIGVFQRKDCGVNECFSWKFGRLTRLVHVRSILGNIGVLVLPDQEVTLIKRLMRMAIWKMKPNRQVQPWQQSRNGDCQTHLPT